VNELGLFAGAGGGLLASRLLGWRTVCAVEIEPYCQRVLAQRQRDGHLEPFPIWDDIRTFDGTPWRGSVDVISGGFPCQDISSAGRGAGLSGDRSGLWFEMLRVIGEVRPAWVFAENSPMLRTRGLAVVLQGLAGLGYDACWGVLGADDVGAPHKRKRIWVVANANNDRQRAGAIDAEARRTPRTGGSDVTDADRQRSQPPTGVSKDDPRAHPQAVRTSECWWGVHRFAGVDDGLADRVGAIKATGNGQVPAVAALAFRVLSEVLTCQR
jgi:DNA (cytosine-5)-methyltransferase 1